MRRMNGRHVGFIYLGQPLGGIVICRKKSFCHVSTHTHLSLYLFIFPRFTIGRLGNLQSYYDTGSEAGL